jgi:CRP-like cAMP-binding protein
MRGDIVPDIEAYLPEHPFFAGLAAPTIALLARHATEVRFEPGEYLFREGEPATQFVAVRQGRITIELHTPAGGGAVLDTAHAGDVVGWSWLIPPYRWMFDARSSEETDAVVFDAEALRAACDADPGVGYALTRRIAQVMAHRLQSARVRLLDLYGEVHD